MNKEPLKGKIDIFDLWEKNWNCAYRFFNSKGNVNTRGKLKHEWYKRFIGINNFIVLECNRRNRKAVEGFVEDLQAFLTTKLEQKDEATSEIDITFNDGLKKGFGIAKEEIEEKKKKWFEDVK